ncbi:hypothetical protein FQN52_002683 [Onygenales sp. PD_12]|nr:hypothetical protein FQN52_002683 [Onygenales sp. PD_12]
MSTSTPAPLTSATTTNEGCTLHYTTIPPSPSPSPSTPTPPLLLFIPGGAGHSTQFHPLLPYFHPTYQPATYSRRQHGLSKPLPSSPGHVHLNPAQQVRDALAVVDALGHPAPRKFYIFGNSGGALIAFHLATLYPERVAGLVAHEGMITPLVPRYDEVMDFLFETYALFLERGAGVATKHFQKGFVGYDEVGGEGEPLARLGGGEEGDEENLLRYELLTLSGFYPDLGRVREAGVRVALAVGRKSKGAFYAVGMQRQSEILGCRLFEVPGNHTGYRYETEAFARELGGILEGLRGGE